MKSSHLVAIFCLLMTLGISACGGGGGSTPTVTTPVDPIDPIDPVVTSLTYPTITLPESLNYRIPMDDNRTNIIMIVPVTLNDDVWQDFFVLYKEDAVYGTVVLEPTKDAIVAYASDGNGGYEIVNYEVFGADTFSLGGATVRYDADDVNGDGIDDFAFAVAYEDGRVGQESIYAKNTILLSEGNYTFSIHHPGTAGWTGTVGMINNDVGTKDVLFAGWVGETDGGDFNAFRYVNGEWVDVADIYPWELGKSWSYGVRALPNPSGDFETLQMVTEYADYAASERGIALYTKVDGVWEFSDKHVFEASYFIGFTAWAGGVGTTQVTYYDGIGYVNWGLTDIKKNSTYDTTTGVTTIFAQLTGATTAPSDTEFYEDGDFDEDDLIGYGVMVEYSVYGNEIFAEDSAFVNEDRRIGECYWDHKDVNDDGLADIIMYPYSRPWEADDVYKYNGLVEYEGRPVLYLNDGFDMYEFTDIMDYPAHTTALEPVYQQNALRSLMEDVNGDGVVDIISFVVAAFHGEEVIEINMLREPIH